MTRREWFLNSGAMISAEAAASALTQAAAPVGQTRTVSPSPQTPLSTRGRFLDWSPEEERYWFFSARDGLDRFRHLAYSHASVCDPREIARSASGLPVYALRLGTGPKRIAMTAGMHGCEPSGPRGLLAYLDALINQRTPFGMRLNSAEILSAVTLHVIPLLNPGGSERCSKHFPDSWQGTWLQGWTETNETKFFAEANEPEHFFYGTYVKRAPMRFTPDQIAKWEATGNVLGSSLTDQALDMWFDWDDTHGVETLAAKALLDSVRPHTVMDIHNFMFPTEVFAPTVYSHGAFADEERNLARSIQNLWRSKRLLFNARAPRPYPKPAKRYYEDYWFHQLGARALIVEVNGGMLATGGAEYEPVQGARALTRRESLETAFLAAHELVNQVVAGA
ncbi:MAG: M14 family zinc carboxypeptidase [Terriglobia bacterium]